jgi:bifunctional DNase/RNase
MGVSALSLFAREARIRAGFGSMRALVWLALLVAADLASAGPPTAKPERPSEAANEVVRVEVRDVVALKEGAAFAVVLAPPGEDLLLPIFIGETEATAIRLRLEKEQAPRPLTHDLLEKMIRSLGGKVTKVLIDDLQSNTYLGKIFLSQGEKAMEIDARPSDSIALALGTGAPIWVARKVLSAAGMTRTDLERNRKRPTRAPQKGESL